MRKLPPEEQAQQMSTSSSYNVAKFHRGTHLNKHMTTLKNYRKCFPLSSSYILNVVEGRSGYWEG